MPQHQYDLQWLIAEGRDHWKRHLPTLYAKLLNSKTLEQELKKAAERTMQEMEQLQQAGMTAAEAWPEVRDEYLILDPSRYNREAP